MSNSNDPDNAERQAAEIALLEAMYPSEFKWDNNTSTKSPSFSVRLQDAIVLHVVLPKEYPALQNPLVTFSAPSLSKSEHHALQTRLNDIQSNLSSSADERLLEIIDSFTLSIPVSSENTSKAPLSQPSTFHSPDIIVLIWFHHLLSLTKRKAILALPLLCGVSKPGYPGILILQGQKDIINDTIVKLRGMKWQAMQVRAETENDNKLQEKGIHEVESVAQVVERMERLGLGEWCLAALRMK